MKQVYTTCLCMWVTHALTAARCHGPAFQFACLLSSDTAPFKYTSAPQSKYRLTVQGLALAAVLLALAALVFRRYCHPR